jgi:hypothetical protein
MRRYDRTRKLSRNFATTTMTSRLRFAALDGTLPINVRVLREGERLDHIAFELWGDSQKWWIIAACSGVGWWLQCPAGTELLLPASLEQAENLVS